ncbi:MAG: JAB domain-containing protein [Clostridia bacterium]|nr:JAB domain-containing protein [Clostridia bacterium]
MEKTKTKYPHAGHRQRMRERYEKNGFNGWAEHEVLEFILFDKIPRKDTNKIAHDILDEFGSIENAINSDAEKLQKIKGIGPETAKYILTQEKIFNYCKHNKKTANRKYYDKENPFEFFKGMFENCAREVLYMVCLDSRNRIIRTDQIFEGTFENIDLNVGVMVRTAVTCDAHKVVLAHNHPSGILVPSDADILATNIIINAMYIVGVQVLDHIIMTEEACESILKKHIKKTIK